MESNNDYSLMRIISQYNHNQEDYHRNMSSLIEIMQQQQRASREVYTFEFGVSDALPLWDKPTIRNTQIHSNCLLNFLG